MSSRAHTVREAMTTGLKTVEADDPLDLAARIMEEHGVRQLIVVDDEGGLRGMISYRDLLRRVGHGTAGGEQTVSTFMDPDPFCFPAYARLVHAVEAMLSRQVTAAPVIEDGRVVGILSEHDIVEVTRRLMEEAGW